MKAYLIKQVALIEGMVGIKSPHQYRSSSMAKKQFYVYNNHIRINFVPSWYNWNSRLRLKKASYGKNAKQEKELTAEANSKELNGDDSQTTELLQPRRKQTISLLYSTTTCSNRNTYYT